MLGKRAPAFSWPGHFRARDCALSASLFYMLHRLYLGIDFKHAMLLRVYQYFGLAFLFVPINALAYVG